MAKTTGPLYDSRHVTRADLPVSPGPGVVLHCPLCGATYSASQGDYFWVPRNGVFRCQVDRTPLELARKVTVMHRIEHQDKGV